MHKCLLTLFQRRKQMIIKNDIFYHIHKRGIFEDKWKVGNTIDFNQDSYNAFFGYYIQNNIKKTDSSLDSDIKIKEYSMLIRELVYEEVRFKHWSSLPSRRHCIWLCGVDELKLWKDTLKGELDIYKVRVTGNIHTCYAGALDDDNINYKTLYNKAMSYWKGECIGNLLEKEYLFEGRVELIEQIIFNNGG